MYHTFRGSACPVRDKAVFFDGAASNMRTGYGFRARRYFVMVKLRTFPTMTMFPQR